MFKPIRLYSVLARCGFLLLILILTGCNLPAETQMPAALTAEPPIASPEPSETPAASPSEAPSATAEPSPTASPTPSVTLLELDEALPDQFMEHIALPQDWEIAPSGTGAQFAVGLTEGIPVSRWTYALAAPFPTFTDDIASTDLIGLWKNGTPVGDEGTLLLADPATIAIFTRLWGVPSSQVQTVAADELLASAWQLRNAWALIPFEQLEPRWKVIALDGNSPVRKDFKAEKDPLTVAISLSAAGSADLPDAEEVSAYFPALNRDPAKIATVVLTGVTALVRGTASLMEYAGMTYPAEEIQPLLAEADILHINNEVPFAEDCPTPYPWDDLVFCSQKRYIELLEFIGTDVVELAGDHFADWGDEAMHYTLEVYQEQGWPVYGGGADIHAAKEPAYFEVNGNKIAFIGCNYKAVGYATASETRSGAVHCDPQWLHPLIRQVSDEGYLPIVTFQDEEYYQYEIRPAMREHFEGAAAAGAVIVSGSQAHQPHGIELSGSASLHYGLGNLFFDQIGSDHGTSWALIDRHVFANGRHISTELITIQFVDFAKSRFSTPEERRALLEKVFAASGW